MANWKSEDRLLININRKERNGSSKLNLNSKIKFQDENSMVIIRVLKRAIKEEYLTKIKSKWQI